MRHAGSVPNRHATPFRQGLFINLFHPKAVLFAAAILIAIFPGGLSLANRVVIALNHLLIEFSFYAALAYCLNTTPMGAVADRKLEQR